MNVRNDVQKMIDALPDSRLSEVLNYLADLQDSDEPLGFSTEAGIQEGLDDIQNGRTMPLSEYRRTRGL